MRNHNRMERVSGMKKLMASFAASSRMGNSRKAKWTTLMDLSSRAPCRTGANTAKTANFYSQMETNSSESSRMRNISRALSNHAMDCAIREGSRTA